MSFNKITIVGYLGRDPELRYTPQGTAVCNFSVARTEKRKNARGEQEEHTIWFRITAWGRQAELAAEYLAKGRQIYVVGRLRLEQYTDRDGNPRTSAEVNASDIQFLGQRADTQERDAERTADNGRAHRAICRVFEFGRRSRRKDFMINVFVGGSQSITKLPVAVAARVDNIIDSDFTVLVGDAIGVDACVQKYLAEKAYANALVFCTGVCRNNAGGWKTMVVSSKAGEKGFDFYALKDREMAREADYGFMMWDGKSKGPLNNVLNLLIENKSALVFFSPEESFHTIRNAEYLSALLAKCGKRALAVFEEKLDISKRLGRSGCGVMA